MSDAPGSSSTTTVNRVIEDNGNGNENGEEYEYEDELPNGNQ